jgi:hypothetical protein
MGSNKTRLLFQDWHGLYVLVGGALFRPPCDTEQRLIPGTRVTVSTAGVPLSTCLVDGEGWVSHGNYSGQCLSQSEVHRMSVDFWVPQQGAIADDS